tara:strand:- start:1206 stop:1337 length:132 start_codon:yes stop_codon:yes gene_type:complete
LDSDLLSGEEEEEEDKEEDEEELIMNVPEQRKHAVCGGLMMAV